LILLREEEQRGGERGSREMDFGFFILF